MEKKLRVASLCVQGGYEPKNGEPIEVPIYQSTTFKYDNSEEMAMLFDLKKEGYFYTRLQNPTNDAVAKKIAQLEGGVGAVLTSSGQAANFYAVFNICEAGDHIVTSNEIYGGTFNLFGVTLKKLGIECTFVNPNASEEEIQKAFRPNTKVVFGETISNPGCAVLDIEKFARIAHKNGVPLIVDNTFATPINCRPFEWGADIVTHSTTMNTMLGFASGVMIAASFWSLLDPAIARAEENGDIPWLVVSIGFGLGGLFLYAADKTLPHMHFGPNHETEGLPSHLKRTILLVFSITLHNIPEGLAVGVAFGAAASADDPRAAILAALSVAIGIGIQNFPEGAAVSIPLRQEGLSRTKAFMYGQASGIVEPIAGVIGALLVTSMSAVLPYALAFAAGAMIYVVVEELIPEAQQTLTSRRHFAVFGVMLGFILMMVLDVALG